MTEPKERVESPKLEEYFSEPQGESWREWFDLKTRQEKQAERSYPNNEEAKKHWIEDWLDGHPEPEPDCFSKDSVSTWVVFLASKIEKQIEAQKAIIADAKIRRVEVEEHLGMVNKFLEGFLKELRGVLKLICDCCGGETHEFGKTCKKCMNHYCPFCMKERHPGGVCKNPVQRKL